MKAFVLFLFLAVPALGAAGESAVPLSPAERRMAAAGTVVARQPDKYQAYNDLAFALIARARETGDTSYYPRAQEAVRNSLRIQPGNSEGEQAHVALLLGQQRYQEALAEAKTINHRNPDAVLVWGDMAYAEAALGDYAEAGKAAQWMMDLRPGNVPAFLCGAALREDWGDLDGAMDFLNKALQQTPPLESEETAWILTGMARVSRMTGKLDGADSLVQGALKFFPDYYLALDDLSRIRMAQHRYAEAAAILETRNLKFPALQSRYLMAEALAGAGKTAGAKAAFAQFEQDARSAMDQPDNANRELVLYYAGRGRQPAEALRIARLEIARRRDVGSLDAYAWALYVNGQYAEAQRQIAKTLAVGAREATFFYHAGAIAEASGDKDAAGRYLKQSLDLDPESEVAGSDRQELARLATASAASPSH